MAGFLIVAILVINIVSTILLVVAPFAVPALAIYLLHRYGMGIKTAALVSIVPVLLFFAWVLDGLYELEEQCGNIALLHLPTEKLGPINALLIIDGPGRWWLDEKTDIERPAYLSGKYRRWDATKEGRRPYRKLLSESELRSRYKITIGQPHDGNFWQRYLTSALITIEERSTGTLVAKVQESAWGGGLAGSYVGALSKLNPFYGSNRYLSCGYAGQEIGIFRGDSRDRRQLYQSADENLIRQVFILATNKVQ
jgi:hypothetical protein